MTEYSKLVTLIASEFNRFVIEHEDVATQIPQNALVIFQVEGVKGFNEWSRKVSIKNREKDQPVLFVRVKKWRQKSYVEELDVLKVNEAELR